MQVGVQVPEVERLVPWAEYVEIARAAEEGGLDSLWVGDHLLYDLPDGTVRGPWECWTLLAGLAAVTDRVRLGPLVAATSFHAPAMLAKQATTVDEISGGRLIVGLGAGWNQREYAAYGFPFDRRVSRFEEAFTIIVTLLREGRIDFEGEFYRLRDMVLDPPARSGIPILVGSSGPRMLAITARDMTMWNVWFSDFHNDPARLQPWIDRVDAAAATAGRDPNEIERTAALLVQVGDAPGRRNSLNPLRGMAALPPALDALAAAGMAHVQLVLDPITVDSVTVAAETVAAWRRDRSRVPNGGGGRSRVGGGKGDEMADQPEFEELQEELRHAADRGEARADDVLRRVGEYLEADEVTDAQRDSFLEQLGDAIYHWEAQHPRLTAALQKVVDSLTAGGL